MCKFSLLTNTVFSECYWLDVTLFKVRNLVSMEKYERITQTYKTYKCNVGFNLYRGQAEREFRVEVEAFGHVRHKNLVRLLGYCIEGTHRYC